MNDRTTSTFSTTASSAEVARNFGRFKEAAQRGPVAITSHGRESLVMLSAEEYARLKALDDRKAVYAHELDADLIAGLDDSPPAEEAKAFNHELKPR